jgi:hypothetical protein
MGRLPFLFRASQQNPLPVHRLGLTFASKSGQPFGLAQAAVSGVIFLRSYVLLVKGDRFSMR